MSITDITGKELFELLEAAIDGVNGYESETGDLQYWDAKKVNRARGLIDAIHGSKSLSKDSQ